jgi:hypothetical protein
MPPSVRVRERLASHPGGNLTGFYLYIGGLVAKRFELLREMAPELTRFAVMVNPGNPSAKLGASENGQPWLTTLGPQGPTARCISTARRRPVRDLRGQGIFSAPARIKAASSCKPSVIIRWSIVRWSIPSVSLPLHVVSIDALGIWKGILGWRGHLKGWLARNESIAHGFIDAGQLHCYRGNLIVRSLLFLGLWRSDRGGVRGTRSAAGGGCHSGAPSAPFS